MTNTLSDLDLRLQEKIVKRLWLNVLPWQKLSIWLARVLSALGNLFYFKYRFIFKMETYMENEYKLCERTLLNEDKTEATLFDQSEDCKKTIYKLLWWEDDLK